MARKKKQALAILEQRYGEQLARLDKLVEQTALDFIDNWVNPAERFRDIDGTYWNPINATTDRDGEYKFPFQTDEELTRIRSECRWLSEQSGYAINGHENRISFIVGEGHQYRVAPRKGKDAAEGLVGAVQDFLDEFCDVNYWRDRQQESILRKDRDGEAFYRYFPNDDGVMRVRFIEPGDVKTPDDKKNDPEWSFGVHTEPDDVETRIEYHVAGQYIEAEWIQHRKTNVDCNVKRGIPLFYPVRKQLKRSDDINRNLAVLVAIQSAIAMVRKHAAGTSKEGVQALVTAARDASIQSQATGKTYNFRHYGPGSIIDASNGMEYDFPASDADYTGAIEADKHILRAIASRLVMPEFMFTSDASNANYASTMVAEGPAVRMFKRLQRKQIDEDLEVLWKAIELAIASGRLPKEAWDLIEIECEPPTVEVRDRKAEAETQAIWYDRNVLSPQTVCATNGWDYAQEQENIREDQTLYGDERADRMMQAKGVDPNSAALMGAAKGQAEALGY